MSRHGDCPFCDPKDRTLTSNATARLLLSNPRKTKGHFLVMPKRHVEKPWDLTEAELGDIFDIISLVERKLIGKLGDGCDVRQNYRPFMKQSRLKIDHMHFHVIPRSFEDRIYQVSEKHDTDLFADLTDEEAVEVSALFD